MTVTFWLFTIPTAVIFLGAGVTKLIQKRHKLKTVHIDWVEDFSDNAVQ